MAPFTDQIKIDFPVGIIPFFYIIKKKKKKKRFELPIKCLCFINIKKKKQKNPLLFTLENAKMTPYIYASPNNYWLTWMHPFLKTGTFQRRASRTRAASSRPSSRRLSAAPGFFITSTAQARLHPGHTHLMVGGGLGETRSKRF